MSINFQRFDEKTPFRISLHKSIITSGESRPQFVYNTAKAYNSKSKSADKGLVFTDKFTAEEIVCRLYHCVIAAWPESESTLKKLINIEPIKKETAEDVLRDVLKDYSANSITFDIESRRKITERIRAVLGEN